MQFGSLVALRNEKPGVTVLTPDPTDPQNYIRFEAKGDPSGGDVQYVNQTVATTPACAKAILSNVISVDAESLSDDVAKAFSERMQIATLQREQAERAAMDVIDRPENRDIVGLSCVGPGTRPGVPCGESVSMRELSSNDAAPLCTRHNDLSLQYIKVEDIVFENDKRVVKNRWVRTQIDRRERQE